MVKRMSLLKKNVKGLIINLSGHQPLKALHNLDPFTIALNDKFKLYSSGPKIEHVIQVFNSGYGNLATFKKGPQVSQNCVLIGD